VEVKQLALSDIVISKSNPRKYFNEEKIKELADSIKEKGVINPILVRPAGKKYELVCGERRLKASKACKAKDIPAFIKELSEEEALELQVIENLQRDDLNPIEEAQGFKALIDKCKYTQETLAKKIGKSQGFIAARIALLDIREDFQKDIVKGTLTPGHLKYLMTLVGCDRILDGVRKDMKSYEQISVKEFDSVIRSVLGRRVRLMSDAEFNKKECTDCDFNRKMKTWNGTANGCYKSECFNKKQRAALKAQKERIKDAVKKGKIVEDSMMKHAVDLNGHNPVRIFDLKGCKGCEHKKIGFRRDWNGKKVKTEVCVNKECFNKKNAEAQKEEDKKRHEAFLKRIEKIKTKAQKGKGDRSFWVNIFAYEMSGWLNDAREALVAAYKLDKNKLKTKKAAAEYFTSNEGFDLEEMFRFLTYWDN
jgi:ParB family chromosome partitioning protein